MVVFTGIKMTAEEVKAELDCVQQAMKDEQLPGGVDRRLFFPYPATISSDDRNTIIRIKELINKVAGGKYPNTKIRRICEYNHVLDTIFDQEMSLKDAQSYKTLYWGCLTPAIQDRVISLTGANNADVREKMSFQQLMYYCGREALSAAE